jgi:hypothetical protein
MNKRAWLKVIAQNHRAIFGLSKEAIGKWRAGRKNKHQLTQPTSPAISEKRAA